MSWLRRCIQGGRSGPRNYWGDRSDGDIRIGAAGAERSMDGGVTWAAIPGWILVGSVVSIPSVQDGDMVVIHARSLTVDAGYTLTVANRCRGQWIYAPDGAIGGGTLSMAARGPHADPADATTSANTPVAPGDGHAVPASGAVIRRLATGHSDSHTTDDLMWGWGAAIVAAEINQPAVDGNGVSVTIPRVGGLGGPGGVGPTASGTAGQIADNAPGGGGGGGGDGPPEHTGGRGGNATCWAGGPGGGGAGDYGDGGLGDDYGGPGGAGGDDGGGGGGGQPGGAASTRGDAGDTGTGGTLVLVCGDLDITVNVDADADGGNSPESDGSGGGPGGGLAVIMYAGELISCASSAVGGQPGTSVSPAQVGGPGAPGTVIGPLKIDY